jgi:hypothetical protein
MKTKITNTIKTTLTILIALLVTSTVVKAIGPLTPTETPGDNTHYTLNDIYNKILNFDDYNADEASGTISTPEGEPEASFRTLTEIYELLANQTDLIPENILTGKTILGVPGSLVSSEPGLPKTGQTTSYTTNDDGDLQAGITMSFTDNSDGTVTDNVTGLMWQQDGVYNATSWQDAIDYCINNVAELPGEDWRLPNIKELQSIVDYGRVNPSIDTDVFTNTQSDSYWSGTTYHDFTGIAWIVYFSDGDVYLDDKALDYNYARCVR